MNDLIRRFNKRRTIIFYIIVLFACLAILFDFNYEISAPLYFNGEYNMLFVYGLIVYKLIELPILYYILVHRHLLALKNNYSYEVVFPKLQKQSKVLFFLIIQGNTVFGLIAYKLSTSVFFFLLFSLIALITTFLIKPNKIFS